MRSLYDQTSPTPASLTTAESLGGNRTKIEWVDA